MSKFMDFYNHVTENEAAAAKFKKFNEKKEDVNWEAKLGELIAFAKEEGYDFEEEEVRAFFERHTADGELSEEELEAVAGGKITYCHGDNGWVISS